MYQVWLDNKVHHVTHTPQKFCVLHFEMQCHKPIGLCTTQEWNNTKIIITFTLCENSFTNKCVPHFTNEMIIKINTKNTKQQIIKQQNKRQYTWSHLIAHDIPHSGIMGEHMYMQQQYMWSHKCQELCLLCCTTYGASTQLPLKGREASLSCCQSCMWGACMLPHPC